MSQDFTLYHYWRSSSSWRVRWALELKKIKPKYVHVNLLDGSNDTPEHLARHPLGYVPVLEVSPKKYLIESVAIIEWLDESFPEHHLLYPKDTYERAHVRALVEVINADTQPIQNLSVLEYYTDDVEKRKKWMQYFIHRGLSAYEVIVQKSGGKYSVGNQITAADLFLIPQCYNALRNDIVLSAYPKIAEIYKTALLTDELKVSSPESFQPKS